METVKKRVFTANAGGIVYETLLVEIEKQFGDLKIIEEPSLVRDYVSDVYVEGTAVQVAIAEAFCLGFMIAANKLPQ